MGNLVSLNRASRSAAEGIISSVLTLGVLAVVLHGSVGPLHAQTPAGTESDSSTKMSDLTTALADVPGIKPGMTMEQLLETSRQALEQGRFADSRKILLAVVAQDRTNLVAMTYLAFVYERSAEKVRGDGSDPEAVAQADRFLDQMADVYLEAATLAIRQNQMPIAEQMYSRLLILRPETSKALLGLARVCAATDRKMQAIDRYHSYLTNPAGREDSDAYLELGELYLTDDRWRQALDALHRAARFGPENADIQDALARAYQKGNRLDEALKAAKLATEKAPRVAKYRATLAELQIVNGDAEQASLEAGRAIAFTRENQFQAADNIALLHQLSDYYDVYERAMEAQLAADKANMTVRVDLARAIQEHAMVDRAIGLHKAMEVLKNAPPESKDDVRLMETLAEVQYSLAQTKDAANTCERLLKKDPDNVIAKRVMSAIKAAKTP